ncbi:MAG TPA: carboxylesterase [Lactobacillus sp.]|nr:carboxylesterase [Lactobacillus sp.]
MTIHFRQPEPLFIEAGPKAVLLLHAYSGSSNDMGMIGRGLARAGYTIYAPMFAGHGTMEPKDIIIHGGVSAWLKNAQDAVSFLKAHGHHQIAVFGLSLGGLFATRLLEIDTSLVGGGTFASPVIRVGQTNVPQNFLALSDKIYARTQLTDSEKKANMDWLAVHNPEQLREIETFAQTEVAANLSAIQRPFFIAQGDADQMIDPHSGAAFESKMQELHKDVTFKVYPNASHVLTVNTAHHQLQTDVEAFLQRLF